MNSKRQRLFFGLFLCFFVVGLSASLLQGLKSFRADISSSFSISVASNLTTAGATPSYYDFNFKPTDTVDLTLASPGVVLDFGTYGFNLANASTPVNLGGFVLPSGSALIVSADSTGEKLNIYCSTSGALFGSAATSHVLRISNIKNPTTSGTKTVKIYLYTEGGSNDEGSASLNFSAGDVNHFLLTTGTYTYTAGTSAAVTVKAVDSNNNVNTGFTSSAAVTQTGGTDSAITYSGTGITNNTLGTAFWSSGQGTVNIKDSKTETVTFTVTDISNSSIVGNITLYWNNAGTVTKLVPEVQSNPAPVAGSVVDIYLYAKDANGNVNTCYNGNDGVVNITQTGGTASGLTYSGDCLDMADGTAYIPSSKWASRGYVDIKIGDSQVEGPVTFTFKEANTPSIYGTLSVTWKKAGVDYLTVTPSSSSLPPGQSVTLSVKAYDKTSNQLTDFSSTGKLSAVQAATGTAQSHVRWNGTGVLMDDQNAGQATFKTNSWTNGVATFEMVNFFSGIQTVAVVTEDSASKTGRSLEITWKPAPTGTIKMNTTSRDIPPDNSTTAELISGDIYDTAGNRIPDGSVFTVMTNLGTITDTDVNPSLPEIQVASTDGKIKTHLKSGTIGQAQMTFQSLSLTQTTTATYPPTATGDTRVMISPLRVNSVSSSVSSVKKNDTNIPVEIEVENISSSSATVSEVKPVFYKEISSGYDVTGEYDITADSSNPATISPGSKAKFKFLVSATRLKTNGTILLDAIVQLSGSTIKFCRWREENNNVWNPYAKTTDTWIASGGQTYTNDLPNYIYQIRSTHGNTSSNFTNGDYIPVHSGLEINFYEQGYHINPTIPEVKLNETALVLNTGYFYDENTGILKIPDVGDKDGTISIKVNDISGNALPTAEIKFKVNANLTQSNFLCYPNPVRAGAGIKIGFQLSKAASVKIFIFNSSAELVWSKSTDGVTGYNEVTWDGVDTRGNVVGGGIYTLRMLAIDEDGHQIIGRTKLGIL